MADDEMSEARSRVVATTAPKVQLAKSSGLSGVNHRYVETNDLRMHIAEQGSGPLVVYCTGSRDAGTPGGTSSRRSRRPASMPSPPTSAATAKPSALTM